ncbi:hypothetical protein C8J57DRAFT_1511912 [Mycena rebaudengoi]|nr:hypothetical protein C8J57DRAFT_1511912 [Mycena rebaudengoi]
MHEWPTRAICRRQARGGGSPPPERHTRTNRAHSAPAAAQRHLRPISSSPCPPNATYPLPAPRPRTSIGSHSTRRTLQQPYHQREHGHTAQRRDAATAHIVKPTSLTARTCTPTRTHAPRPTTALWVVKPATTMLSCSTRRTRVVGRAHLHAHVNARPQAHSHDKPMPTPEPARTNRHARARETRELRDKDAVDVSSSPHRRPRDTNNARTHAADTERRLDGAYLQAPASTRAIRKTRGHASAAASGVKDARGARRTAKARATRG